MTDSRRRFPAALRLSGVIHVAMATALATNPLHWRLWLASLFANHVGLFLAAMNPRNRLLGPNLRRLPPAGGGSAQAGRVALTFDDGPDPVVTPKVLEILERFGVTASFFLIGRRAERYPELARRIVSAGHAVHSHTWSHSWAFAMMAPPRVGRELDRTYSLLREIGAKDPCLVRAPAGIRPPWLETVLVRRGAWLTSWTRRGFDAVDRDPRRVLARLERNLSDGDILLLHDGRTARHLEPTGPLPVSLEILPSLLDGLRRRELAGVGLSPETVDEAVESL